MTLPSGKTTASVPRYYRAWRNVAKPFEKLMGWKLHAFDPGFAFLDEDGESVRVDNRVVIAIYKLSKEQP